MNALATRRGLAHISRPHRSVSLTEARRALCVVIRDTKGGETSHNRFPSVLGTRQGHTVITTALREHIVGCSKRARRKAPPLPQISTPVENKRWRGDVWKYIDGDSKGRMAVCLLCDKKGKYGAIQQHCKQHFPEEYHCAECSDSWHLKTQWQEHFLYECRACRTTIKGEQNFKKHLKTH